MKNKMWFNVIMTIVGILFILSCAVTVVLYCRPLYYHDIKSLDIESYSGYDEKEIREYRVDELKFKPRKRRNDVKLTKEEMRELSALEKE